MINYSVIIPHYNIPELLVRCINSIPVREDIQVIVVDDCSPGADKYKAQYPELSRPYLEYYSTPKGGSAGRARNIGVKHAKGKWLSFLDADDLFPADIEAILDQYKNNTEDLILLDFASVMSNDLTVTAERNPDYHQKIQDYLATHKEEDIRYSYDPMWGKLVKKELVDKYNIKFDETRWSNDCYFALSVGIHAQSLLVSDHVGYILTQREGSLADNLCGTLKETTTRLAVALKMRQLLIDNDIDPGYSPVGYIEFLLFKKYSRRKRLSVVWKFWRYPKYMCQLIVASSIKKDKEHWPDLKK